MQEFDLGEFALVQKDLQDTRAELAEHLTQMDARLIDLSRRNGAICARSQKQIARANALLRNRVVWKAQSESATE